jgi:hypothetical protein
VARGMGLRKGRGFSGFRHARACKDEGARFLPRSMGGGGLRRQRYGYFPFLFLVFSQSLILQSDMWYVDLVL